MEREREIYIYIIIEGSLQVNLPTIWTDDDRWKSRNGKSQRREEKKKEDQKRESIRRKKTQVREKVGKSWNTVFFQWFVALEGPKVGSLQAGAEPAGQMRDEKLHAVVARSTFSKSKCTNHTNVRPLLAVVMLKKCTPLWRKASQNVKSTICGQLTTSVYWFIHYYT